MDVLGSEAYWRHEQDILFDVVRQMKERHMDSENYPELMELQLRGEAISQLIKKGSKGLKLI